MDDVLLMEVVHAEARLEEVHKGLLLRKPLALLYIVE